MTAPKRKRSESFEFPRPFLASRSKPSGIPDDPRLFFTVAGILGLVFGIMGWVLASTYPGVLIPVCAVLAIILGLLGVRSKMRSLGLIGFVMGMFLLPNAITTLIRMFGS